MVVVAVAAVGSLAGMDLRPEEPEARRWAIQVVLRIEKVLLYE